MKHRVHVCLILRLFVAGIILFGTQRSATGQNLERADSVFPLQQGHSPELLAKASTDESKARIGDAFARLPLSFEANRGQTDPQVKFLARGQGYTLFLTRRGEAVLALSKPLGKQDSLQPGSGITAAKPTLETAKPSAMVRMSLVGAAATPQIDGVDKLSGKANYFVGNDPKQWNTNVPLFAKVKVRDIYPGVDLLYYGSQQQLEYDFIVEPGGDSHFITMNFSGAKNLSLDAQGDLVLRVDNKDVRLLKPVAYQEVDGQKREVASSYELKSARQVGFHVAAYDRSRPLIIDPVLAYSTYLGGSGGNNGGDSANAIAVDSDGNAYVTGFAGSIDFPTTPGAFQTTGPTPCPSGAGCSSVDAFVTKLNPAGSGLVYSTYLGGSHRNYSNAIAVDSAGNAYVTGKTCSTDFPTTPGAFQTLSHTTPDGYGNAFVTKLNASGSGLVYSTYLGGSGGYAGNEGWACTYGDTGYGIAVDPNGDAYVAGYVESGNFPTTPGAFQPALHGPFSCCSHHSNAFIAQLNPTGSSLVYSTYLGGSDQDWASGITVGPGGDAFVAGITGSNDFPTTPGALKSVAPIGRNGFVTRLNPLGSQLIYSTYLGGSGSDQAQAIAIDSNQNAYVTGYTTSIDFPTTPLAFQPILRGPFGNAFVAKLDPSGSGLVYSTYLGGSGGILVGDMGFGIAVDAGANAYITGYTSSADFPTTLGAFQSVAQDQNNGFVTKLNDTGSALVYSTYLGGTGYDYATAIAVDFAANAYVTGITASLDFPTTPGAFQATYPGTQGSGDGFVTKLSGDGRALF